MAGLVEGTGGTVASQGVAGSSTSVLNSINPDNSASKVLYDNLESAPGGMPGTDPSQAKYGSGSTKPRFIPVDSEEESGESDSLEGTGWMSGNSALTEGAQTLSQSRQAAKKAFEQNFKALYNSASNEAKDTLDVALVPPVVTDPNQTGVSASDKRKEVPGAVARTKNSKRKGKPKNGPAGSNSSKKRSRKANTNKPTGAVAGVKSRLGRRVNVVADGWHLGTCYVGNTVTYPGPILAAKFNCHVLAPVSAIEGSTVLVDYQWTCAEVDNETVPGVFVDSKGVSHKSLEALSNQLSEVYMCSSISFLFS